MFQVEWLHEADEQLAAIWMRAESNERSAIVEATNTIDRELKTDPFRQSESRDEDRRVLYASPLGVFFSVDMRSRVVWVGHVWYYRRRPK
jgi:hypothetical protein